MYYKEILSQAARRAGYESYAGLNKEDLLAALRFAEEDLLGETEVVKATHFLFINKDLTDYTLPINFGEPHELVVYNQEGAALDHEEITYEMFMRWNPGIYDSKTENELLTDDKVLGKLDEKARLYGKAATCIRYDDKSKRYRFFIKPPIDGKVELYYAPALPDNIFDDLAVEPRVPKRFHRHLVDGVVMNLMEYAKVRVFNNPEQLEAIIILQREAERRFRDRKKEVVAQASTETKPKVIRPFMWYDNPRKYR